MIYLDGMRMYICSHSKNHFFDFTACMVWTKVEITKIVTKTCVVQAVISDATSANIDSVCKLSSGG